MPLNVQTRAFIKDVTPIKKALEESSFVEANSYKITDDYYAKPGINDPENHTFEKDGEDMRIRTLEFSNGTRQLLVQKHKGVVKTKDGKFSHGISDLETSLTGLEDDINKALDEIKKVGFTDKIATLKKSRTVYVNQCITVNLDKLEKDAFVIEISQEVSSPDDFDEIKASQLLLLEKLGVNSNQIIDTGYTHKKITQLMKNDPVARKEMLLKELEDSKRQLKEKEMLSGLAYTDTGDGWHENPTYETLYHDILSLNQRIIEIKQELLEMKK